MTKKVRVIILVFCVVCFLVGTAIIIPYSMGYRFDFEKMKIVAIGGIHIKTFPVAEQITIDSDIVQKSGFLQNDFFVQNLLPREDHTVLIQKTGYYDYFKTLPVLEKQVTKLENVLLIKKDLKFDSSPIDAKSPFDVKEKAPVIKNLLAFQILNNSIIWLSTDGFLYKSDITNLSAEPIKLTITALKTIKTGSYKITLSSQNILLNNNGSMLIYNKDKSDLENFTVTAGYKKITDCQWIGDYNIVFLKDNKIIISETDTRGNINTVTLPQAADKIFFNQQEGKLYVLIDETLLVSEKIIP